MVTAVYPGTFDPFTRGHEDIVRRACKLFGKVILGIADSDAKRPIFNVEERVLIAREVLSKYENVEVTRFSGLLVNFVRDLQGNVVVRGLRAVTDFEYEFQLAGMNRHLMPEIETIFMTPTDQYQFVSGTLVREIAVLGGDVSKFVTPNVEDWIKRKLVQMGASPPKRRASDKSS